MTACLLLVHGWGLDASFWAPLRAALPEVPTLAWDLGFTGHGERPLPSPGSPVIAVGHSFGLLWLLHERPIEWCSLVSINGFSRFSRAADLPAGTAPRLLARMIERFGEDPAEVHASFLQRCGIDQPAAHPGLDRASLGAALDGLARWDERPAAVDLALAGRNDPIAPPDLTEAVFAGQAVEWHPGGHLLPRQDPEWCARRLFRLWEAWA